MECTTPVDYGQKHIYKDEADSDQQSSMIMPQGQLQLQDPILTILMMPLMHINQIMIQINKMIAAGPMQSMGMQPATLMPFTPLQSWGGLKITELKRDSSGNIVSILEKW